MSVRKKPKQSATNLFAFRPVQKVLVGIIVALLLTLVATRFAETLRSQDAVLLFSDRADNDHSLRAMQRESVDYVFEFGEWLNGVSTKREVQIRRALLAQLLVVKDTSGVAVGERVSPKYLQDLSKLDLMVFMAQPGYLSTEDSVVMRSKSKPTIDTFVAEVRAMEMQVMQTEYRQRRAEVDAETRRRANVFNLVLTANLLIVVLGLLLAMSRSRDYRKARSQVLRDQEQLLATQSALEQSKQEAREQMEIDEAQRREVFRLDSLAMPILSKIRESVDKQQIIDELMAGVGMSIGADWVVFHSFPTPDEPRIFAEWRSTGNEHIDQTEILRNEEALKVICTDAWNGSGFLMRTDSQFFDIATQRAPGLNEFIRQLAKSWVLVPLGEGSQVLGYIAALMYSEPREWSSDEILFVRTLAANASHSIIHVRSLEQSRLIAEQGVVVKRLMEIDRMRTNFIGNVNHELRTPLASIIGYLELIQESAKSDFDPGIAKSFNIVMRNTLRLQKIVENTLLIASLDGGNTVFDTTPINLGACLRESVESFVTIARDGEVTVNLDIKDENESLLINCNQSQMEQVFTNLISNAIKFTPKTGTVTVTAQHIDTENGVVIEVTIHDTGIGIPEEEAKGLFQRFTRGSNAMDAQIPGTGLGLTIVKEIVDLHRGSITFTSKVGEGTTFTVRLPVGADLTVHS